MCEAKRGNVPAQDPIPVHCTNKRVSTLHGCSALLSVCIHAQVVEVCGSRGTPSIALASALAQVGRALGNLRSVEVAEGRTASGPDDKQLCPSLHLLRTLLATVER